MSSFIDFEDKSVDKAIEKACEKLGISRDKLKYDIISYGSSGIFGLVGAKKAHIRVRVAATESGKTTAGNGEHPSSAKPKSNPRGTQSVSDANNGSPDSPGESINSHASKSDAADENSISALVDEAFGKKTEGVLEEDAPLHENRPAAVPHEQLPGEKPLAEAPTPKRETPERPMAPEKPAAGEDESVQSEDYEAATAWIRQLLDHTLNLISPESTISIETHDAAIRFNIQGGDSARLIGKRGQTIDAIQYLVEKATSKQFNAGIRFEIDVEGYLEKRKTELTEIAFRLAEKAANTGKTMAINHINANDRRMVHLALKENQDVRTQSAGNGDLRKLLILPKKKPAKMRKNGDEGGNAGNGSQAEQGNGETRPGVKTEGRKRKGRGRRPKGGQSVKAKAEQPKAEDNFDNNNP